MQSVNGEFAALARQMLPAAILAVMLVLTAPAVQAEHDEHDHQHRTSPAAHVHGEAVLNIVIDGESVLAEFISPLENLLGFEHQPTNEAQQQAFEQLQLALADHRTLFEIPAADCTRTEAHSESPFAGTDSTHAQWQGEYFLECRKLDDAASLKPQLFSAYPGIEKLTLQLITAQGQSQFVVTGEADTIPLR